MISVLYNNLDDKMKYSLNMLGEYVNGKWSEDQVEHWLQMLGLNPLFTRKNNDVFIELEIPSNRGDLLSALGIIRALTPYMEIEPKYPDIDLQEKSARKLSVEIESPDDCFFYAGRVVESVSIGPSPEWLRERVESAGFRSVNNVVDITNLVFWEFGQPLHAFDIDLLKEKIIVRRAREGEEIITLDGTKRNLCNDVLVISDSEKPVALAGIMGGINSEVGPNTKNLFIESAFFNPVRVRRGAKYLGMCTDASARFEKGITPSLIVPALDRCCWLINKLCGGSTGPVCVVGDIRAEKRVIRLSMEKISNYLGCEIQKDFVITTLERLGCCVERQDDIMEITIPDSRNDIEIDADIIEEIAKYWGYDRIPESMPLVCSPTMSSYEYSRLDALKDVFIRLGFSEVINLGLGSEFQYEDTNSKSIEIINPLSRNYAFLRCSMIQGLLQNIQDNSNRKVDMLSIFEIGSIYKKTSSGFDEKPSAGIAVMNTYNLYYFKGIIEYILRKIGYGITSQRIVRKEYGRVIEFLQKEDTVGRILIPCDDILKKYDVEKQEIFLAEIMLQDFVLNGFSEIRYKEPPRSMPIRRDLSLIVPNSVDWRKVEEMLLKSIPELEKIEIFDIYIGRNIPEQSTGVAIRMFFPNPESSITKQDIEHIIANIIEIMQKHFSITLRQ